MHAELNAPFFDVATDVYGPIFSRFPHIRCILDGTQSRPFNRKQWPRCLYGRGEVQAGLDLKKLVTEAQQQELNAPPRTPRHELL